MARLTFLWAYQLPRQASLAEVQILLNRAGVPVVSFCAAESPMSARIWRGMHSMCLSCMQGHVAKLRAVARAVRAHLALKTLQYTTKSILVLTVIKDKAGYQSVPA